MSMTLNGMITDEKLLLIFRKIDRNLLDAFSTEDYLVINSLYHTQKFPKSLRSQVKHLAGLGITEHIGNGKYILSHRLFVEVGAPSGNVRLTVMNRKDVKELILSHIRSNSLGTSLSELQQILPHHSRSQIQKLLYELKNDRSIFTEGRANKARWYLS